jgi:excisionase family DNA binding protein
MSIATARNALDKFFYTLPEVAEILRVHPNTVGNLIRRGRIPFTRVGGPVRGRVLISRDTLLKFFESQTYKG